MSKGRRDGYLSSRSEKDSLLFLHLFCSVGPSTDWMVPTHTGEGESSLLSLQIQKLISSGNISQTHSEIMFYQLSGHPLAWSR